MATNVQFAHQLWDVQRLLFVVLKKESTMTCAMAKMPQSLFKWVVQEITDYLCTPPHVHSHPSTVWACKICFTPICDSCEGNAYGCLCGANDMRHIRGPNRTISCHYKRNGRCYHCAAIVTSRHARACAMCGSIFLARDHSHTMLSCDSGSTTRNESRGV